MPAESGKVFYDDSINSFLLNLFIDFIDAFTVEMHTADIVIERFADNFIPLYLGIFFEDISLVGK